MFHSPLPRLFFFVFILYRLDSLPFSEAFSYYVCRKTVEEASSSTNNSYLCPTGESGSVADDCSVCYSVDESPFEYLDGETMAANCGGPCDEDDVVVQVNWKLPRLFCKADTTCQDDTAVSAASLSQTPASVNPIYRTCTDNADCPESEGYCCSKPSSQVFGGALPWRQGCGPPSSCGCADEDPTGDLSLFCTEDCPDFSKGVCMKQEDADALPGYSCSYDACQEDKEWAYRACGFDAATEMFSTVYQSCSSACTTAVLALNRHCPSDPLVTIRTPEWWDTNCGDCQAYYYQRCTSNDDCNPGWCCSMPVNDKLQESDKGVGSCGPPANCFCEGATSSIWNPQYSTSCTKDCSPIGMYGTCVLPGENTHRFGYTCSTCPTEEVSSASLPSTTTSAATTTTSGTGLSNSAPTNTLQTTTTGSLSLSIDSNQRSPTSGDHGRRHLLASCLTLPILMRTLIPFA